MSRSAFTAQLALTSDRTCYCRVPSSMVGALAGSQVSCRRDAEPPRRCVDQPCSPANGPERCAATRNVGRCEILDRELRRRTVVTQQSVGASPRRVPRRRAHARRVQLRHRNVRALRRLPGYPDGPVRCGRAGKRPAAGPNRAGRACDPDALRRARADGEPRAGHPRCDRQGPRAARPLQQFVHHTVPPDDWEVLEMDASLVEASMLQQVHEVTGRAFRLERRPARRLAADLRADAGTCVSDIRQTGERSAVARSGGTLTSCARRTACTFALPRRPSKGACRRGGARCECAYHSSPPALTTCAANACAWLPR